MVIQTEIYSGIQDSESLSYFHPYSPIPPSLLDTQQPAPLSPEEPEAVQGYLCVFVSRTDTVVGVWQGSKDLMKAHCRVGRHQGTVFSMLYHTLRCGQHNRQLVNLSLLCTCLPSSILAMHICHIMLTLEKPTVISLMSIVFMSVTHLDCMSFMFLSGLKHGTSASSAASALIFGLHHFKVSSKMDPEAIRKVMFS